jgi:hypothetical protein
MPKYETRGDFTNEAWGNLGKSGQGALALMLQEKLKEKEQKKAMQGKIQQALLEAALKNMRLKEGADLSGIDASQGMQGILGQIPGMFERQPAMPSTSINISERPYTEMLKAREIAARTPAEYGKAGMAKKTGGNVLGIPTGWGFGSQWDLSPEAEAEQKEAKTILGSPYKTTKRISYKGDVIDTTAEAVSDELPDPSEYDEGTVIEDESGIQYKLTAGEWVKLLQ